MMRHSPETHFLLLHHMDQLAPKVGGHRCLSPLMYKAKGHSRCGRGSEKWQQQLQQQSHVPFQRLGSSKDTTCINEYGRVM